MAHYFDTSALVKLVIAEAETRPLRRWLARTARNPVSCDLTRAELIRAVRKAAPEHMVRAMEVLRSVTTTEVTTAIFDAAGRLDSPLLRTLDAVHLAAALDLGDDLDGFVTYDHRLAEAARGQGIPVVSPT